MKTRRVWLSTALACVLVTTLGHGQTAEPTAPLVPPATNIVIGDQLIDSTSVIEAGRPVDLTPGSRFLKPRGATVDSNGFGWRIKFSGWDAGVIPIQFSSELSTAQREFFANACADWGRVAQVSCIPRTSQSGYVVVRQSNPDPAVASGCYSNVGQARRLVAYEIHLSPECWNTRNVHHELGHAFGFIHEHQRPDRDAYISIDLSNVAADARSQFDRIALADPLGPYDFLSVMHYPRGAFAADSSRPTIVPQAGYGSFATTLGTAALPSDLDHAAIQHLYTAYLRPLSLTAPLELPRTQFDRNDFLDAMERLHAFYYSRMGLNRPAGLSVNNKPDFLGLATWIFDIYLAARSRGFSAEQAFGMVVADISQSTEWRGKHPGQAPLTRPSFTPVLSFDRAEFLDTLNRLDAFYQSADGLQRPEGLSISGGPDFLGIATWLFDVYLNERLRGSSSTVAWSRVVSSIQATDEWRRKH